MVFSSMDFRSIMFNGEIIVSNTEVASMVQAADSMAQMMSLPVAIVSNEEGLDIMLLGSVVNISEILEICRPVMSASRENKAED